MYPPKKTLLTSLSTSTHDTINDFSPYLPSMCHNVISC